MGSSVAGRGSMSSPSTRTANVSLSTSIDGRASFSGRLAFERRDTSFVGTRRRSPSQRSARPASSAAGDPEFRPSPGGNAPEGPDIGRGGRGRGGGLGGFAAPHFDL